VRRPVTITAIATPDNDQPTIMSMHWATRRCGRFGITHGSTASRAFASYLGITDPWDFNQHKLVPSNVDVDGLRAFLETLQGSEELMSDLEAFLALRDAGFDFYFRPNG
jgi:hypothetical protein